MLRSEIELSQNSHYELIAGQTVNISKALILYNVENYEQQHRVTQKAIDKLAQLKLKFHFPASAQKAKPKLAHVPQCSQAPQDLQ